MSNTPIGKPTAQKCAKVIAVRRLTQVILWHLLDTSTHFIFIHTTVNITHVKIC
ncbi:unnamed protein product, partial [Ixodes pacificus]